MNQKENLKKFSKYIATYPNKGIKVFKSKKNSDIFCIEGQHKQSIINKLNELNIDRVDTWESFYNKKWTTFIKIK